MKTKEKINLPDILKETPFTVPNGYFEKLPARIMGKCENERNCKKVSFWRKIGPAIGFAASFLILFGIAQIAINIIKPDAKNYMSNKTMVDENIFPANEINDAIKDEIISYLANVGEIYELDFNENE